MREGGYRGGSKTDVWETKERKTWGDREEIWRDRRKRERHGEQERVKDMER